LLRVKDSKKVTLEEIQNDLASVPFVFVGEHHDNMQHHVAQLEVIKALDQGGRPIAIGLEMIQHKYQAALDRWVQGTYSESEFQKIYQQNWSNTWALYRDIFLYAKERKIPMVGLNVSPEITRQVARQGFASLTDEQLGALPEVVCEIDDTYMAFIRRVFGAHSHGSSEKKQFVHFCEAQLVWDTAMAWHLLSYHQNEPTRTIVVLAGNGHAWRRGIPEQIKERSPLSYRIILPQIPGQPSSERPTIEDTDYLWLTDP
jgi:uncharacterized iron-regulated protein